MLASLTWRSTLGPGGLTRAWQLRLICLGFYCLVFYGIAGEAGEIERDDVETFRAV